MTPAPCLRVLIADDDEDQLIVRSLLLECAGFSVTRASDVSSALRLAAATQPHCAVVDLRLPTETEGLRLIRELKAMSEDMELFVLTGADPKGLCAGAEGAFVREVLQKPIASGRLVECLKQVELRAVASAAREENA